MFKLFRLIPVQIIALAYLASIGFAQTSQTCSGFQSTQGKSTCAELETFITGAVDKALQEDYLYYLATISELSYPDLRLHDIQAVIRIYDEGKHLVANDTNSIIWFILDWFSKEQSAGGAGGMEAAILELNLIASDTTQQAIAYVAAVYGNLEGETNYTPWDAAIRDAGKYSVEYLASSRHPPSNAAQERPACLTLATPTAQEDCKALYGYLEAYISAKDAPNYFFHIEDLVSRSYPELRAADAVHLAQIFEADGHLVEGRADRDSRRIIVSILIWIGGEQTPVGAGMMEASIKRLHRHAPETTKQAIAYVASVFGNIEGETLYSPWSTAVNVSAQYVVDYRANSRLP